MDRQPVLEGQRLRLRPLTAADWPALHMIGGNPEVWAGHPEPNRWQEPVFRAFFDDALAHGGALAVIDKASGAMIGSSRFQGHDPADGGSVEIGWSFLARERWGEGLNSEMKVLMLAHALRFVRRVVFRVGADNVISRKAMAKIGGRLTGEIEVRDRAGVRTEHVIYEITREDFENGPLVG